MNQQPSQPQQAPPPPPPPHGYPPGSQSYPNSFPAATGAAGSNVPPSTSQYYSGYGNQHPPASYGHLQPGPPSHGPYMSQSRPDQSGKCIYLIHGIHEINFIHFQWVSMHRQITRVQECLRRRLRTASSVCHRTSRTIREQVRSPSAVPAHRHSLDLLHPIGDQVISFNTAKMFKI